LVGAHDDPRLAEAVGRAMGRELRAVGIDLDFAPVLDVHSNPRNRVIGDRAFAGDPARVARLGLAFARGLARAGVLSCGKHFPGHGATAGDSHFVLPRVGASRRALAAGITPFARAARAGLPALMTAHVVYSALDSRRPATLSRAICHDLLRRRLGFRGLLFSDDLEMHAVAGRGRPGRTAVEALRAGCDMLLVCQSLEVARAAMEGVEDALARGRLPPERVVDALTRIEGLRRRLRPLATRGPLRWPAHARLARRIAAAVSAAP
jgi:beta-N-acetylhexosaminidase